MERWSKKRSTHIENPAIDAFIEDVLRVCQQHGLSIEHEDGHGSFEIATYNEDSSQWLRAAADAT